MSTWLQTQMRTGIEGKEWMEKMGILGDYNMPVFTVFQMIKLICALCIRSQHWIQRWFVGGISSSKSWRVPCTTLPRKSGKPLCLSFKPLLYHVRCFLVSLSRRQVNLSVSRDHILGWLVDFLVRLALLIEFLVVVLSLHNFGAVWIPTQADELLNAFSVKPDHSDQCIQQSKPLRIVVVTHRQEDQHLQHRFSVFVADRMLWLCMCADAGTGVGTVGCFSLWLEF